MRVESPVETHHDWLDGVWFNEQRRNGQYPVAIPGVTKVL